MHRLPATAPGASLTHQWTQRLKLPVCAAQEFERESRKHGWPSFRDQEVHWENMRCLKNGEAVSLAGTHLGHNLPDRNGNRYCINLVSVAGRPVAEE